MVVQLTHSINHNESYPGMKADQQLNNTVSKLNKGTISIVPGKAIVTDGEDGGKLPVAASVASQFIGVVMRELNRATPDGVAYGAVPGYDFAVITFGSVWVIAADIVKKDDPAYMRVGATNTGDFANVAGAGATLGILIPNAKFMTAGNVGDLVKISLSVGG